MWVLALGYRFAMIHDGGGFVLVYTVVVNRRWLWESPFEI